jgi:hypothetical protein
MKARASVRTVILYDVVVCFLKRDIGHNGAHNGAREERENAADLGPSQSKSPKRWSLEVVGH